MKDLFLSLKESKNLQPLSVRDREWIIRLHATVMDAELKRPSRVLNNKYKPLLFAENRIIVANSDAEMEKCWSELKRALEDMGIAQTKCDALVANWTQARQAINALRGSETSARFVH